MIKNPKSLALSMRKATRILNHAPDELASGKRVFSVTQVDGLAFWLHKDCREGAASPTYKLTKESYRLRFQGSLLHKIPMAPSTRSSIVWMPTCRHHRR